MRSSYQASPPLKKSSVEAKWIFPVRHFGQRHLYSTLDFSKTRPGDFLDVPTGQPLLAGCHYECLSVGGSRPAVEEGGLHAFESDEFLAGFIRLPAGSRNLEDTAYNAFHKILDFHRGLHFCRFWNFVPDINRIEPGLMENYKAFCCGRARAFSDVLGGNSADQFPAASATGCRDGHLTVIFLATKYPVHNWENPEQVPAYQYPRKYGPRAPAFARASMVRSFAGDEWIFISGTAAIKGHESQCLNDFKGQLEVTLNNVDLTLHQIGLRLDACDSHRLRHMKVFLRDKRHLAELLDRVYPICGSEHTLTVVEADICRHELEVEIELTIEPEGVTAD